MRFLCALLAVAILTAGCQTAADQLVDLPPTDRAVTPDPVATTTEFSESACERADVAPMPDLHPSVDDYPEGVVELIRDGDPCGIRIPVLVADTPERRSHGLMEVPVVPDGVGMWFGGYTEDRTGGFWMMGTRTDLDIAYIDVNERIVDIIAMEVCSEEPCPTYPPDAPYRTTLEVAPGWFTSVGITEGDRVHLVSREDG